MRNILERIGGTQKPATGDLVVVHSANEFVNAYLAAADFSFANVAFTAKNGEMGVVLNGYSDERNSILYHYVRILFARGLVGIVHSSLLKIMTDPLVSQPPPPSVKAPPTGL